MRRSGASDSYELSLVYDDGSGHTSYHKLIDTSGRKLWLNPGLIGAAVGNGKQLLYVNSNGTVNTSNSSSGGTDQPAYLGSGEIKPCDFKCWHYQPGTGKYTFQYEHIAIIFLHRGDGFKIAFCDNWNAKKDVVSNNMDDVTVSVSNKTVTINSTRSSSVSAMIITS